MQQEVFGKFIVELRKERKLTQKELAKKAVHETVEAAKEKQKRTLRVSRIIIGTLAALLLIVILFGIQIVNFMLDNISAELDAPYHTCEIQVEPSSYHPYVAYYIYRKCGGA